MAVAAGRAERGCGDNGSGVTRHHLGRSQKYHRRPRHLYALLFDTGCAYVGQTVDLEERERQHRRESGGWAGLPFHCVHLATIEATEECARDHEHAWRHRAAVNGWGIYAKPPGIVVDHRRQMTLGRYLLAWTLRWPAQYARDQATRGVQMLAVFCGLLAAVFIVYRT